jgi:ribosomal protein S27AE
VPNDRPRLKFRCPNCGYVYHLGRWLLIDDPRILDDIAEHGEPRWVEQECTLCGEGVRI